MGDREARTVMLRVVLLLVTLAACDRGSEPEASEGTGTTDTASAPVAAEIAEAEAPPAERPSFAEAHMASAVDASRDEPDPATYTATFPASAGAIYVVYRLQAGAGGRVTIGWKHDGGVLLEDEQTLPADGTWAFNAITPPPGGFLTGTYEVELRIPETGDLRTLSFAVHPS